jgi:hypothetical protein
MLEKCEKVLYLEATEFDHALRDSKQKFNRVRDVITDKALCMIADIIWSRKKCDQVHKVNMTRM